MSVGLWQIELQRVTDPDADETEAITEQADAEQALAELGIEYDHIEPDWPEGGVWLVGLTGEFARFADRGDEVWHTDRGWIFSLPQP